jgi:selenocysteine lyase/cysteine desulfurase
VHPWGTVRASASYFTEEWEIEKFIAAIKDIVATFVRKKK